MSSKIIAEAPGRTEILGNHTDYNEGFVLLSTVDLKTRVSGSLVRDEKARIYAQNFKEMIEFGLDGFERDANFRWADYPKGVIRELQQAGILIPGFEAEISGTIPLGVGLSSSAALELAFALFLLGLNQQEFDRLQLVKLCRRAENEFVGVNCGILDQFSSAFGRKNAFLFLDCRDLSCEIIPLPEGISLIICDSGVRRSLTCSDYNKRGGECQAALKFFAGKQPGIRALRDVTPELFKRHAPEIPEEPVRKRAEHIICENARVLEGKQALINNRLDRLGELMLQSHRSSRDLFENSTPELDFLVEAAYRLPGVIGAKLSGAGWGGATVNLVHQEHGRGFSEALKAEYRKMLHREATVYVCSIVDGAGLVTENQP